MAESIGGQKAAAMGCLGVGIVVFLIALLTCSSGGGSSSTSRSSQDTNDKHHCISELTGRHTRFVIAVKNRLNDPRSFRHIETRFSDGTYLRTVVMEYTAKNAYGGTIRATARGTYNRDCSVNVRSVR